MYSEDSNGSSVSEIIEFLNDQDKDSLPQELKDILEWHKSNSVVTLSKDSNGSVSMKQVIFVTYST